MAYSTYDRSLTSSRLKQLFLYDQEQGGLTRRSTGRRRKRIDSYRYSLVEGAFYPEHHLVWLWFHGEFPPVGMTLDHVNRVEDDNRIENLRLATQSQNQANTRVRSDNALGLKGVYFHKTEKKYRAVVWKNGRAYSCGQFDTAEEAHVAACTKRKELYGAFSA